MNRFQEIQHMFVDFVDCSTWAVRQFHTMDPIGQLDFHVFGIFWCLDGIQLFKPTWLLGLPKRLLGWMIPHTFWCFVIFVWEPLAPGSSSGRSKSNPFASPSSFVWEGLGGFHWRRRGAPSWWSYWGPSFQSKVHNASPFDQQKNVVVCALEFDWAWNFAFAGTLQVKYRSICLLSYQSHQTLPQIILCNIITGYIIPNYISCISLGIYPTRTHRGTMHMFASPGGSTL